MNYPYEKGESVVKLVFTVLDCAGFFILCMEFVILLKESNFMTSDFDSFLVILFVFSLFMFLLTNIICIGVILLIKNNRNKKIKNIMNLGYKTNGKVLSIGHERKSAGGHIIEAYWLVVQFMDRDGVMKTFNTPAIMLVPKPGYFITCDVFVYNNRCYAYNFTNFYIETDINKERRIVLVVVIVLMFVMSMLMMLGILVV